MGVASISVAMKRLYGIAALAIVIGVGIGIASGTSGSHHGGNTTITGLSHATSGPASGQVEYICTNGAYSGDVYNATIAAVQDATGKWLCASPAFPTQSVMALTGRITCTYDVIQKAPYQYWTTRMDPLSPTGYERV